MRTPESGPPEEQQKKRSRRSNPSPNDKLTSVDTKGKAQKTQSKNEFLENRARRLHKTVKELTGAVLWITVAFAAIRSCGEKPDGKVNTKTEGEVSIRTARIVLVPSTDPEKIYPKGTPEIKRMPKLDQEYPAALKAIYFSNPDTDTKESKRTANDVLSDLGIPSNYQDDNRSWFLRAEASSLLCKALLTELQDEYGSSYGAVTTDTKQVAEINLIIKQGIDAAEQIKDYWPATELELKRAELWRLAGNLDQSESAIRQAKSYVAKLTPDDLFIWFRSFVPEKREGLPEKVSFTFRGGTISISAKPDEDLHASANAEIKIIHADVELGSAELYFEKIQQTHDTKEISDLSERFLKSVSTAIHEYDGELRHSAHALTLLASFLSDGKTSNMKDLIRAREYSSKAIANLNGVAAQVAASSNHSATFAFSWSEQCLAFLPGLRARLRLALGMYIGAEQKDLSLVQRRQLLQEAQEGANALYESRDKTSPTAILKTVLQIEDQARQVRRKLG